MTGVTVYPFKCWNSTTGDMQRSQRLGTLEAIETAQCVIIREGAIEMDASLLDGNGFTREPQAN